MSSFIRNGFKNSLRNQKIKKHKSNLQYSQKDKTYTDQFTNPGNTPHPHSIHSELIPGKPGYFKGTFQNIFSKYRGENIEFEYWNPLDSKKTDILIEELYQHIKKHTFLSDLHLNRLFYTLTMYGTQMDLTYRLMVTFNAYLRAEKYKNMSCFEPVDLVELSEEEQKLPEFARVVEENDNKIQAVSKPYSELSREFIEKLGNNFYDYSTTGIQTIDKLNKIKEKFWLKKLNLEAQLIFLHIIANYTPLDYITEEKRWELCEQFRNISGGLEEDLMRNFLSGNRNYRISNHFYYSSEELKVMPEEVKNQLISETFIPYTSPYITLGTNIRTKQTEGSYSISDLYGLIKDPKYKNLAKEDRKPIYATGRNIRPVSDNGYQVWSGFQAFDVDIKDTIIANEAKNFIYNELIKYPWFIGVALSSSGNGLHIYTAIDLTSKYSTLPLNEQKEIHKFCYYQKHILINNTFLEEYGTTYSKTSKIDREKHPNLHVVETWMDTAMDKPQQGIFLTHDPQVLFNPNFILMEWDSMVMGADRTYGWIYTPYGGEKIFGKKSIGNSNPKNSDPSMDFPAVEFKFNKNYSTTEEFKEFLQTLQNQHPPVHYKYKERYHIVNTLASQYTDMEVMAIISVISKDTPMEEWEAYLKTARNSQKIPSMHGVFLLKKHGFSINMGVTTVEKPVEISETPIPEKPIETPSQVSVEKSKYEQIDSETLVEINGEYGKYLGDYQEILTNTLEQPISEDKNIIHLIAPPGSGKTELLKQLSKQYKILALAPLNSIIESKFEVEGWGKIYGTTNTYQSMTEKQRQQASAIISYDKYAAKSKQFGPRFFKQEGFDFLFIDECHTIVSSQYRSIMSDLVSTLQKHRDIPVVMMTGTPMGENSFIGGIRKTILFHRNDTRSKRVNIRLIDDKDLLYPTIVKDICTLINDGKKIIYPTNLGEAHTYKITMLVQEFMRIHYGKTIKTKYYCRANKDTRDVKEINETGEFGDIDILFCTSYLGLGVDILNNTNNFRVIFDQFEIATDIDQWANRLRRSNLEIDIYGYRSFTRLGITVPVDHTTIHAFGSQPNYKKTNTEFFLLTLNSDHRELHQRIYNNVGKDSPNSHVLNRFPSIYWNDNIQQFSINETTLYLGIYEDQYRDYHKQTGILKQDLINMGYEVNILEDLGYTGDFMMPIEEFQNIMKQSNLHMKMVKAMEIHNILDGLNENTLMCYSKVFEGKMEVFKSLEGLYEVDKVNNRVLIGDIKQFEKLLPTIISLKKRYRASEIRSIFESAMRKNGCYNFTELRRLVDRAYSMSLQETGRLNTPSTRFIESVTNLINELDGEKISKSQMIEFLNKWVDWYLKENHETFLENEVKKSQYDIIYNIYEELFKSVVKLGRFGKTGLAKVEIRDLTIFKTRWDYYRTADELFENLYNLKSK